MNAQSFPASSRAWPGAFDLGSSAGGTGALVSTQREEETVNDDAEDCREKTEGDFGALGTVSAADAAEDAAQGD